MAKVIGETRTGVQVGRDAARHLQKILGGSGKKVTGTRKIAKGRNWKFLQLLIACGHAPLSSGGAALVKEEIIRSSLSALEIPNIKAPKWKETSDHLRAFYYQAAAEALGGQAFALSLNIAPHVARKALEAPQGRSLDYLRRAVARNLKRRLARPVDFWLIMETAAEAESDRRIRRVLRQKQASGELGPRSVTRRGKQWSGHVGQPHMHGTLIIQNTEVKAARSALRVMNAGVSKEFRQSEIALTPITDGFGWAGYITKHMARTRMFLPDTSLITTTNPVSRVAAELYEADRQFLLGFARAR